MVFSSLTFLFYLLPITLIVYFILSFSRPLQNFWLFLVSLVFYAWGEPVYIVLLLVSIVSNYLIGLLVGKYRLDRPKIAKGGVVLACVINLGILFVFKYLGFVCESINTAAGSSIVPVLQIALPIGISFFTFQALSYVIDVYRGDSEVQKNPFWVGLYIAFFPQLVAGPIVKYKSIAKQINDRKFSADVFSRGVTRFATGVAKKVLLANNLAVIVDDIFNLTATGKDNYSVPVLMAWLGAICYTMQIYMDFSGYSDMAIGLGQMFGFQFEENFNYPYISKSIGEFWRRWHISLGTWFKEYVYFPLGGSRVSNMDIMVRNTLVVWLLTGIWHGANWTFLFWGLVNFVFLIFERLVRWDKIEIPNFWKHIYCMLIITVSWVMFRADSLYQLSEYFGNMFGTNMNGFYSATTGAFVKEYAIVLFFSVLFCMPVAPWCRKKVDQLQNKFAAVSLNMLHIVALMGVFTVSVISLIKGGYNPFIYFNF